MYEFIYGIDIEAQMDTSDSDPEPRHHYEVHCGKCHWWGMRNQLKPIYHHCFPLEDVIPEPACPICLSDQWLEYKED